MKNNKDNNKDIDNKAQQLIDSIDSGESPKNNESDNEYKNHIDDSIGWKNPKELLKNSLFGIFMGISDAIPGYSGGTTLSIIGFYDKLIENLKNIFKPTIPNTRLKHLLWVIPFILTWVLMLVGMFYMVHEVSSKNWGVSLVFLFASFAFFSLPFFFLSNKKEFPTFDDIKTIKNHANKKKMIVNISLFTFGFIFLIIIAIVIRTALYTKDSNGNYIYGISFLQNNIQPIIPKDFNMQSIFTYLFAGFFAGFCMLIPGVSGSMMLYLFNIYPKLSSALQQVLTFTKEGLDYFPQIIGVSISMILGIVSSVICISWVTKKYKQQFYCLSAGLVSSSFLCILIALSSGDYNTLSNNPGLLGVSISMIFIALIINGFLFIFLKKTKRVEFPNIKIKNKN